MKRFTLTDDHLTLLRAANVTWQDAESGAPGIDCKRPYGNSGPVESDVARILCWHTDDGSSGEDPAEAAYELHRGTEQALAILLALSDDIEPGEFAYDPSPGGLGWFRVDPELGPEGTLSWLTTPL